MTKTINSERDGPSKEPGITPVDQAKDGSNIVNKDKGPMPLLEGHSSGSSGSQQLHNGDGLITQSGLTGGLLPSAHKANATTEISSVDGTNYEGPSQAATSAHVEVHSAPTKPQDKEKQPALGLLSSGKWPALNRMTYVAKGSAASKQTNTANNQGTKEGMKDQGGQNIPAPRTWVNLFKDNRNPAKGIKLQQVEVQPDRLSLQEEELDKTEQAWGCSLVGYIAGKFPGKYAIFQLTNSWNVAVKLFFHEKGWIVFKFVNEDDRAKVLLGGPYMIYGRSLLLKCIPNCFNFNDDDMLHIPLWITLPGLPLECWNAKVLSKIASKIGKPITTDEMTENKKRVSYARVLIEVDVTKPLTRVVPLSFPNGRDIDQVVRYEFEPKVCLKCNSIRHGLNDCPIKANDDTVTAKDTEKEPIGTTLTKLVMAALSDVMRNEGEEFRDLTQKKPVAEHEVRDDTSIEDGSHNSHFSNMQAENSSKHAEKSSEPGNSVQFKESWAALVGDLSRTVGKPKDNMGKEENSVVRPKTFPENSKEQPRHSEDAMQNSSDHGISVQFYDLCAALVRDLSKTVGKTKDNKGREVNSVEKPPTIPGNSNELPRHREDAMESSGQHTLESSKAETSQAVWDDSVQEEGEDLEQSKMEQENTKPFVDALPARNGNDKVKEITMREGTITRGKAKIHREKKRAAALSTQR